MADDHRKTRAQLLAELEKARQRIAELEYAPARVGDRESSARKRIGGRELDLTDITKRKKAEQTLLEYVHVIQATKDFMAVLDEQRRYAMVNESLLLSRGLRREEVVGSYIWDVVGRDLYEASLRKPLDLCYQGQGQQIEVEFEFPALGLRALEIKLSPVLDPSGRVARVAAIASDITERKRAEAALKESEVKFRALAETSPMAIMLYQDDCWLYMNPAAERISGYSMEEMQAMPFWGIVHPDFQELVRARGRLRQEGKAAPAYEFKIITKQGEERWVHLTGDTIEIRGHFAGLITIMDITDRKNSEEALRRSEEKYRTILENMDEAYFELDLAGNLTFFNDAMCKNLGYSREELLGMNNRYYTRPELWKRMYETFKNIYLTGEPARIADYEVMAKDGRVIIAEASAHLMRDEKGVPVGFRGLARDMTERKKSEQERQKLQAQLIQAQKMEAVGTLAGGIAHDFNNILQSLKGNIQLWLRKMDESDPGHTYLDRMDTMTDRATDLVRGLLTFSRTSSPQDLKPVDLNLLIAETVEILKRTVPKMFTIHTRLNAKEAWIHGESTQLQQVLMNLVSNARDAMAPKKSGNIWIETANVRVGREERARGLPCGDSIQIKVSDSGAGMGQQTLEHIFEPFFSTKDVGQGTGLGLAMVYGIVQTHEGWIDCASQEGEGSEFTITLPLASAQPKPDQRLAPGGGHAMSRKDQPQQRRKRVLLVDDEAPVREVTREWLEEKDFQVVTAQSGEEALDQVERNRQDFDVLLLDLNMPGMGGEAALKGLLKLNPQLRIIVISGYSSHPVSDDASGTGAAAFLTKPFTLEELSFSINQVLGA